MRKTLGKYVPRTSAFALACLALAGADVMADGMTTSTTTTPVYTASTAVQDYSTGGGVTETVTNSSGMTVQSPTITGTPDITFVPISSGTFASPSAASLGYFQVGQQANGTSTTYTDTPFSISYKPVSTASIPITSGPITISGTLTGTISTDAMGNQSSHVIATFDKVDTSPVFQTPNGSFVSTVSVDNSPLNLVAYSAGANTTVQADIATTAAPQGPPSAVSAPEPTTMVILASSLVGLGLRKKLRMGRKSS